MEALGKDWVNELRNVQSPYCPFWSEKTEIHWFLGRAALQGALQAPPH